MILGIISAIAIAALVFAVTHLYPLTPEEVQTLAQKRRRKSIRSYFSFDTKQYAVDKGFKKRMNPKGARKNLTYIWLALVIISLIPLLIEISRHNKAKPEGRNL